MQSVKPEGQTGPFLSLNKPQSRKNQILSIFNFLCLNFSWTSVTTLLVKPVGPEGQMGPFSSSNKSQSRKNLILLIFVCYSSQIFGDRISKYFFSKFFMNVCYDLINGARWSRGANIPISKFKQAPQQQKHDLTDFLCPEGKTGPFSRSNEPQSKKN
ncbi:hypothetical protein H5410_058921 [Solanum commersonii]|uniref:Uncharacterized protein n=1 Tax=Solanum commersonii TaxID=4109 RepID=A0A9J5W0Z1_SOLCO|nr:hypothetical protein H5410_058921 [Solanum commersonii]